MIITEDSHTDHITTDQLEWLHAQLKEEVEFGIHQLELPENLGPLTCALYGPIMGDDPIKDAVWVRRKGREYSSRVLLTELARPTTILTVICGPHKEHPCILYTAFGGPPSPQELRDPTLHPDKLPEAEAFWADHALAFG